MDTARVVGGEWGWGLVIVLVVLCAWTDLRTRRVLNAITVPFAACGLLLSGATAGLAGAKLSVLGAGLGLLIFLIPYAAGGMGAGDVKLIAAVGAYVGYPNVLFVILYTVLAGGAIALGVVVRRRALREAVRSTWHVLGRLATGTRGLGLGLGKDSDGCAASHGGSVGRIPYAVAIAAGTCFYLFFGWVL